LDRKNPREGDFQFLETHFLPEHKACEKNNVKNNESPETSNEESSSTHFAFWSLGSFITSESEIVIDEENFIQSYNDHPQEEQPCNETSRHHQWVCKSRSLCSANGYPFPPTFPLESNNVDDSQENGNANPPALEEPPFLRSKDINCFFE